jgi:hypothetical protein
MKTNRCYIKVLTSVFNNLAPFVVFHLRNLIWGSVSSTVKNQ